MQLHAEPSPFPPKGQVHTVHTCAGFAHSMIGQWVGICFYNRLAHDKNSALIWIRPGYDANSNSLVCQLLLTVLQASHRHLPHSPGQVECQLLEEQSRPCACIRKKQNGNVCFCAALIGFNNSHAGKTG